MTEAERVRHGYQQFVPPQAPPGCISTPRLRLTSKSLRSVGDLFAGTVILYDPDEVLGLSGEDNDRHVLLWSVCDD